MGWSVLPDFVLSPDSSHRVAIQLISEPYQDWKDLLEDIRNHAFNEYHLNSTTRLNEFFKQTNNPEKDIGVAISRKNKEKFEENREILMSNTWSFVGDRELV